MNLVNISKNIPNRKYIVVDISTSSWSSDRIKGIHEFKIDGDLIIEDTNYTPIKISQISNEKLNKVGVNYVLYVMNIDNSPSRQIRDWLDSDAFVSYQRDNNIEELLD